MPQEDFVTGRYENRGGCRTYLSEDEIYPCPFFQTFETRIPYFQNRNYDLTREARDWRPDQVNPDLLAPKMKSRRNLRARDRPEYVNTFTPRPTLAACGQWGYMPTCDQESSYTYEGMTSGPSPPPSHMSGPPPPSSIRPERDEETSVFNFSFTMNPDRYEMPGLGYDPPGYDDCSLNF